MEEVPPWPQTNIYGEMLESRTNLYQYKCLKVPTHADYIEQVTANGGRFTHELKEGNGAMPYMGTYTQEKYAQAMIDEYIKVSIPPACVWSQHSKATMPTSGSRILNMKISLLCLTVTNRCRCRQTAYLRRCKWSQDRCSSDDSTC